MISVLKLECTENVFDLFNGSRNRIVLVNAGELTARLFGLLPSHKPLRDGRQLAAEAATGANAPWALWVVTSPPSASGTAKTRYAVAKRSTEKRWDEQVL